MKIFAFLAASAAIAVSTPAFAQDGGAFSVGVTGGTLGIGPEVAYRMSENIGVRGNATFFDFSRDVDSSDVTYTGDLKLKSGGLMVDVFPFGGGFRISAGARIGDNKVELAATPTENVEIGDDEYTPAQIGVLSGEVAAKDFAPTATIGWGGGLGRGVTFGAELGAMFHGSPRVNNLTTTGTLRDNAAFKASLAEEEAEIEADLDDAKIYPIVQFSLGYRF